MYAKLSNVVEPLLFKTVKKSVRTLVSNLDSKVVKLLDGPDIAGPGDRSS